MKKKNLLLTAVATLGLTAATMAQSVPSYVPTIGLVGWWPFNGNANDESGNNNNGIVTGATLAIDRNNLPNKSFFFSTDNWSPGSQLCEIFIPYSAILSTTNISVMAWINPSNNGWPGSSATIINKFQQGYSNPNGQTWVFQLDGSNTGNIQSVVMGPAPNNSQPNVISTGNQIQLNNWSCVIFTFDGTNLKTYVNGMLQNTAAAPSNFQINTMGTSGISIGVSDQANGFWSPYKGYIDDIGIWNRALTPQEITGLYNVCSLSVNAQPTNQTININNNAQFMVGSSDPNATYQWQTDLGVGFQNLNSVGQYSGTTNDTLTVSNVTMSNNNQPFRCIVSSGSCSDTSNVALLTVNNNVGINETNQGNLFSVFPNPAQSIINVKTDSKLIGSVYSIFDNNGRVAQTGIIATANTEIDLNTLSEGMYVLKINEQFNQSFRIIKN
jgi:hypothetical protein